MTKEASLEQLKKLIETSHVCPELEETATQLVFGSGNPDAEIVFIGEAPGKQEDLSGEPFVGAAGKFLNKMLASVGLKREDIYITNIVKYRPPENRDPLPEEKHAFWPYLLKQLALINPKIIVTLGRHSGQAFIKDLRISADHGQPKRVRVMRDGKEDSLLILPLYHPAAALYDGSLRTTLIEDFQSVPTLLQETKKELSK
ncbi:MAG TPA: uracil-DNA glycosylase [Candidatus Saccharibacteria bacterium]|nr:uracil-DNA glycosylase [Candidatus Saccharibacteria bacterium]HMT55290.1 uracil-DNA glycosylase [Candidatus Saccharibacteria bacterium]